MRPCFIWNAVVGFVALVPAAGFGQGAIGGVVRDTSGGVLPGVTVDAASPALIERVRTAMTDDKGQYLIVDLRPGVYTVTFTLAGFSTLKHERLELSAGVTLPVNAELKVGGRLVEAPRVRDSDQAPQRDDVQLSCHVQPS